MDLDLPAEERLRRQERRRERFAAAAAEEDSDDAELAVKSRQQAPGKPIVGCSHVLFRPFVRLRSAPDPGNVRPERLLKASLAALLDEDAQPPGGWQAIREQFWSIRQDLLVQHLHRGDLAADVCLQGMRLAVQHSDLAELHRCLAPLVANGACAARLQKRSEGVQEEVAALRLLYLTHGGLEGRPGRLSGELCEFFQGQPVNRRRRPGAALDFAFRIHDAQACGLWTRHLSLAATGTSSGSSSSSSTGTKDKESGRSVGLSQQLAKQLCPAVRTRSLAELVKAFPQGISAALAARLLGFAEASELVAFLKEELRLHSLAPSKRPLGSGGRLDCSVVAEYLEKIRAAEAEMRRKAAGEDCSRRRGGAPPATFLRAEKDSGEASIWKEMEERQQLQSFFASSATKPARALAPELLSKKAQKKLRKQLKKEQKKDKKRARKEKKKQKKKLKKERKAAAASPDERDKKRQAQEGFAAALMSWIDPSGASSASASWRLADAVAQEPVAVEPPVEEAAVPPMPTSRRARLRSRLYGFDL
eukprot:TRINITY_DN3534_c0_g3_i1.p1 TRINITY_DN3534_c0_g3~~TRINITY_DN3534_c0_g3_i1.p1  ORF type:complete len:563 (-),score=183.12 TRINITY_DN3534_c0_g3_i1:167-1768(-)